MLGKIISVIPGKKNRDLAMTAGGMLGVLGGSRVPGLAMFGKGLWGLEQEWRAAHPEFKGGFAERWQAARAFYEETHQHPTNRRLHKVGIWMILGGTAGLILAPRYRPLWMISASSFVSGWALNFVGHGVFEKNGPAFADDPLSFAAAIAWDVDRMRGRKPDAENEPVTVHGEVKVAPPPAPEPAPAQAENPQAKTAKAAPEKSAAKKANKVSKKKATKKAAPKGKAPAKKKAAKKATKKTAKKAASRKGSGKKATRKATDSKSAEDRINVKNKEPARV
jgi:hypothetical protein